MVMAPPGHVFIKADFSFIELVTFAAYCYRRYGFSKLGDTIKAERDPHCYTAALLLGMSYDPKEGVFEVATANISHRVAKPKEIYVREQAGTLSSVEIIAQDDTKQIVELRPLPALPAS